MGNAVNIISCAPFPVAQANRPFGTYIVPAAPKGGYSKLRVTDVNDWRDMGNKRYIPLAISARALADDLIKDVTQCGVFVIDADEPTEEQLKEARERLRDYFLEKLQQGDADFRETADVRMVSAQSKLAAEHLGQKRDWLVNPTDLIACPNCDARIRPETGRCQCGALINPEKAREFLLLRPGEEETLIALGRLEPLKKAEVVTSGSTPAGDTKVIKGKPKE